MKNSFLLFISSLLISLSLVFLSRSLILSDGPRPQRANLSNDLITFENGHEPAYWRIYNLDSGPRKVVTAKGGSFKTIRLGSADSISFPGNYNGEFELVSFVPRFGSAWDSSWQDDQGGNWQGEGYTVRWGANEALATPADYDGDGLDDFAVFDPTHGTWHLALSKKGRNFQKAHMNEKGYGVRIEHGSWGDVPVVADYDGDGRADLALFQPDKAVWKLAFLDDENFALRKSPRIIFYGREGDIPLPGDYDCDGKDEIAVYRPSEEKWFIRYSHDRREEIDFGVKDSEAFLKDFDGDGCVDLAFFNDEGPEYFTIMSSLFKKEIRKRYLFRIEWGAKEWVPVEIRQRRYYFTQK